MLTTYSSIFPREDYNEVPTNDGKTYKNKGNGFFRMSRYVARGVHYNKHRN
jgi:hypothetical protein